MSMPVTTSRPPRRKKSLAREVLETAVLTIVIFLLARAALQNFKVDGQSMEPNLHNSEYVLVNKVDYLVQSPHRGDIVVFQAVPARQPDRDYIKRVIGLPGETVAVHGGAVFINQRRLAEPYIKERATYTFGPSRVPAGSYFVLGDNRNNSFDSSKWTATHWLARKYIIGKAWIIYWPLHSLTLLRIP